MFGARWSEMLRSVIVLMRKPCAKSQALNLEGSVQFIGAVSNDQVVQWYRRSFVHVNCSPPDHSLDKAVLEAMACGKPSLSSTIRVYKRRWGNGPIGCLFQQGDPEDLARKIEWLTAS